MKIIKISIVCIKILKNFMVWIIQNDLQYINRSDSKYFLLLIYVDYFIMLNLNELIMYFNNNNL